MRPPSEMEEGLSAGHDNDIYEFNWLTDNRIIFGLRLELVSRLEQAHVTHEALPGGSDRVGLSPLDERLQVCDGIEAFLDRNLASTVPPPAPNP